MITQIEFDEATLEATVFFAEALVEFQQAYMAGREYAQGDVSQPAPQQGPSSGQENANGL